MDQQQRAQQFQQLHIPGDPLVLFNIWDAGSAITVAEAGAPALATGSWSVAAAHGYQDGQQLPMETLLAAAKEIVKAVELPVSIDFEGAYADHPESVARNVAALIRTGAIGMNFEDQRVGGEGLFGIDEQAARICAARAAAQDLSFFINARTDVFLKADVTQHEALLEGAIARGRAYADAGASGFFAPGLTDLDLLGRLCAAVALPVNAMRLSDQVSVAELAACGVARISHGPGSYRSSQAYLHQQATAAMQSR